MADGFHASPESLRKLKKGLEGLVNAQKKAGAGAGDRSQGNGLQSLDISEMDAGGKEFHQGLATFKYRWRFQNLKLYEATKDMADAVGATAESVEKNENEVSDSFKGTLNLFVGGDPNESKKELRDKSVLDVAGSARHWVTDLPDQFSQDTWNQHKQHIKDTWKDGGEDYLDTVRKRAGPDEQDGG